MLTENEKTLLSKKDESYLSTFQEKSPDPPETEIAESISTRKYSFWECWRSTQILKIENWTRKISKILRILHDLKKKLYDLSSKITPMFCKKCYDPEWLQTIFMAMVSWFPIQSFEFDIDFVIVRIHEEIVL